MKSRARLGAAATVLGLALVLAGGAFCQTTIVLQPDPAAGADTYVAFASNVQNYGAEAQLTTNSQSNGGSRGLVRFDLSSIPAGATISSATFEMYHYFSRSALSESLRVHRLTRAWTEPGATWRAYDGVNSWTTAGGDFDPAVAASTTVNATVNVWRQWNVTALVQSWISGSAPNFGMILDSPSAGGNNERQFYTSDYLANPALRPKLTIVYVASDLTASTKSVSPPTPVAGQTVTYTIVVKNAGTAAASNVAVTDAVDTTKLGNVVPGQGGVFAGGTITWRAATTPALGSVSPTPAGDVTLSFTARVLPGPDGTVISNQAFLASATQTGIPSDDPSTVATDDPTLATLREPVTSLAKRIVEKNGAALPDDPSNPPGVSGALSTTVVPGDVLTYAVFFANNGSRNAVAFVARDGVPLHTDFIRDAFAAGKGIRLLFGATSDLTNALDADAGSFSAAAVSNPDDPATPINGLVTVIVGNVPAGSSGSLRFKVRVR
ncbi:MAG TPA: DNRLRE domain-containing protein [Candidatus Polarisedimenticolia bacterium]|nr:DNRLRE domain-containing protein [Candidatus Polarisedimenticolia bacterium]